MSIYRSWLRQFFTYVIPVAAISYFPALTILGRGEPFGGFTRLGWMSPLAGVVFLLIALRVWSFGVRKYQSTWS